jgi:hypothetical protein
MCQLSHITLSCPREILNLCSIYAFNTAAENRTEKVLVGFFPYSRYFQIHFVLSHETSVSCNFPYSRAVISYVLQMTSQQYFLDTAMTNPLSLLCLAAHVHHFRRCK